MNRSLVLAAIASLGFGGVAPAGLIYGIKSLAPGTGPPSAPPAHLFSFDSDGAGFTDFGAITLFAAQIDADALAVSDTHGLLAYRIEPGSSTLIRLETAGANAAVIGDDLVGRQIRGAAFDGADRLWVIDSESDELLRVDPVTGAVLSSVSLHRSAGSFDLVNYSDLAIRADGQMFISSLGVFYTVDGSTGLCEAIGDPSSNLAGITFCADAPAERLYGFDIDGPDDIFTYGSDSGFHASLLIPNIISTFNSGRGDLASVPAPPSGCNPADLAEPFGLLDLADVTTFVAGFLASDPIADLDGSGLLDLSDVILFVDSFLGGCP